MIIGITGGVGSGKSTILNIMQSSYKARLIMADNVAKSLMKPGNECYDKIIETFGEEVLLDVPKDQLYGVSDIKIRPAIDREKLSRIVFNDSDKLTLLESIIHPAVKKEILSTVDDLYAAFDDKMLIILEAALLIEEGYKEICDDFWVVIADKEIRIDRLMQSRKYSREKCESIMSEQMSDDEYSKHADFIIDNSGDIEKTAAQIKARLKELGVI